MIQKAVSTKADVVARDEKENGIRAALNYGHTYGHVIENETGYKTYLHGEAVAIGMILANATSVKMGLMSEEEALRVKRLLEKYDLPVYYEIQDVEQFYETFYLDKKSSDTKITFILPIGIGDVTITNNCEKNVILDVLSEMSIA